MREYNIKTINRKEQVKRGKLYSIQGFKCRTAGEYLWGAAYQIEDEIFGFPRAKCEIVHPVTT